MFVSGQWWIDQAQRTVPSAVVLTAFVCAIAYVRSSRLKALIYSMPVPFTCAYLATALPINATYLAGLILVVGYNWAVCWLHIKLRVPLLVAIVASALAYFASGMQLRPIAGVPVWWIGAIGVVGWLLNLWLYRPAMQPDHRGRTPWWLKAPLIFVIAMAIYNATKLLAGAVGTFPYAGVFTSYEMRHSLRTLAGQFTINALGILSCMLIIAAPETRLPAPWPLLLGWVPVLAWAGIVHWFGIGRPEVEIEE
jgi:hypothetical protein